MSDVIYKVGLYPSHPYKEQMDESIQEIYETMDSFGEVILWTDRLKDVFQRMWILAQSQGPILVGAFNRERTIEEINSTELFQSFMS